MILAKHSHHIFKSQKLYLSDLYPGAHSIYESVVPENVEVVNIDLIGINELHKTTGVTTTGFVKIDYERAEAEIIGALKSKAPIYPKMVIEG